MNYWYTLFTKANAEIHVSSAIKGRGIEIFLPQIRVPKSGHKQFVLEPLFPCYIFMRADLHEVSPAEWRWTPGLRYMLHIAGEPAVVSEATINILRQEIMSRDQQDVRQLVPYKHGEIVRINRGPLVDLLAVFDEVLDGNGRSRVLVNFLGQVNRVKVDLDNLEKAPSGAPGWSPHLPRRTRGRGRWIRS
jgi:transcriptional antiterminator RfaH